MIKPEELHQYMLGQLSDEQRASEAIIELLPVIVKGIIIAVKNK
jgi:Flp pilus assembly protein TadB